MNIFENKGMRTLAALSLIGLAAFLFAATRNELKEHDYIGRPSAERDTITISGEGRVTAIPDIATTSIGVQTERTTVAAAQKENTEKMNTIIERLKDLGIEKEDIKTTSYNVYPVYDYNRGTRTDRGFSVDQRVTVKIRDLDKTGEVLAAAAELGANQVGGLNFTVDEPEELRQDARLEALEAAKKKADALTKAAGVKLGGIVGFNEGSAGYPQPVYRALSLEAYGGADTAVSPEIEQGSQEVVVTVSVTYEIIP